MNYHFHDFDQMFIDFQIQIMDLNMGFSIFQNAKALLFGHILRGLSVAINAKRSGDARYFEVMQ